MNKYRSAREFCFQFFFHTQLPILEEVQATYSDEGSLLSAISELKESTNTLLDDAENAFVQQIITTTLENSPKVEEVLSANLKNWKLDRISKVDKTILMIGVSELLFLDTPPKVSINEAIDLSKKFGTKESPAFINGLLDKVATENGKL